MSKKYSVEDVGKMANDEAIKWKTMWPNQDPGFILACKSAFADGFMRGFYLATEPDLLRQRNDLIELLNRASFALRNLKARPKLQGEIIAIIDRCQRDCPRHGGN